MAKPILDDALWGLIEPLLPEPEARRRPGGRLSPGRPPVSDRQALTGILFVLRTGIPWEYLPAGMGCGSGMTCRRRLRDWHEAGVWAALHRVLMDRLNAADKIDWSRAVVDTTSVRAMRGGKKRERAPWTGGRRGPGTASWSTAPAACR
jgi:transposase